jgi:hypothetical protein
MISTFSNVQQDSEELIMLFVYFSKVIFSEMVEEAQHVFVSLFETSENECKSPLQKCIAIIGCTLIVSTKSTNRDVKMRFIISF